MKTKQLLRRISEKIGELSAKAVVAKYQGDDELEQACKKAIFKLMDVREKLIKESKNEKGN